MSPTHDSGNDAAYDTLPLGLFISKSIIEAHGGKIWGKNNYPDGNGTMFGSTGRSDFPRGA